MLERIVNERWLTASGAAAFYPASAVGDDIEVYADESRREVLFTWHGLRQQTKKPVIDGSFRLTVGSREQMQQFVAVFCAVTDRREPGRR